MNKTACIIIIGNEILSGKTQDLNVRYIANRLSDIGIDLIKVIIIRDIEEEIIEAVKESTSKYNYVFSTGGIGPTHDDITTESVAKAFNKKIITSEIALKKIKEFYDNKGEELNQYREKMANIPEGADLIKNDITKAPGFKIDNLFVLAGVPSILQNMFGYVEKYLDIGDAILQKKIIVNIGESSIAKILEDTANKYKEVDIGSYPFEKEGRFLTEVVFRGTNKEIINKAYDIVKISLDNKNIKYTL